ncbi:MAG TPA: GTP-sensing pleiotropic transcriptional regulator CodY [Bacillota bacterium]|nr:GTP-sensing pleiotropic transcriptional regulator CodY [Bacillota bacterium]HOR85332.1 GTP-sensing pleiotropic transcriptional regulator CodY [Bacillota bacterium]HPL54044.1 GTP-sensing pleiotropic transcriptional regulator CodY [Bacillota bacterium]
MSSTLLEKIRKVSKVLQTSDSQSVSFHDLSNILSEVLNANVYILSRKGRILGYALGTSHECDYLINELLADKKFPDEYNKSLLGYHDTRANLINRENICVIDNNEKCGIGTKYSTIVPVNGSGERLGTVILAKYNEEFTEGDLVLAEYGATVVGLEILRSKNDEIEEEARKKAVVQMAIGTLSYSELEAIEHIFRELDGNEGLLVASKIADKVGITRSVIVNALRKFESAGVIESRSLGMKGTHIRILNEKLLEELKKIK